MELPGGLSGPRGTSCAGSVLIGPGSPRAESFTLGACGPVPDETRTGDQPPKDKATFTCSPNTDRENHALKTYS
jgi:hypothetical protein